MKRFFICYSLCMIGMFFMACPMVSAQSIDEANARYKAYVQVSQGTDKAAIYNALYQCYESNMAVLRNTQRTQAAYRQALSNMKDIMPALPNGAAYSSSIGQQTNATMFARAFVDAAMLPDLTDAGFVSNPSFAQLSYFAAANLFNSRLYKDAIPYLQAYVRSGEEKYRKTVYQNLCNACFKAEELSAGFAAVDEAISCYPSEFGFLQIAINASLKADDKQKLQHYVTKALALRPNDSKLLDNQGKLYEENRQYQKALDIYTRMQKSNPRNIDIAKHLVINNYNIAVLNYNKALSEQNKAEKSKLEKQYKEYFAEAIVHLKNVVASEPTSIKYNQALAIAYKCTEQTSQMDMVNNKLSSLGGGRVASDVIPSLISFSDSAPQMAMDGGVQEASAQNTSSSADYAEIPAYSVFARDFIEKRIEAWQQKDAFENITEYKARVSEQTRNAKVDELRKQAEQEYISRFKDMVDLQQLELKPYDAENGVFMITSPSMGQLIVPVPRSNNEARLFAANWTGMQFADAQYGIADDHLALAKLTFITPTGKKYQYDNHAALNYTQTKVTLNLSPLDNIDVAVTNPVNKGRVSVDEQQVVVGSSDVDVNIPETKSLNANTFAVVIANEKYINAPDVAMASNDGSTFAKYCEKTLGLPRDNVRYYPNASFGTMLRAVKDIKDIAVTYNGELNILFYYAGHGIPNEATKDAYLLPVDADGTQTEGCYSLNRLYKELGDTQAKSVVVFLDACFSGSLLASSARGVAIKAKKEAPHGNMVVLSAASGDETAYPYKDKGHGLFTYYLLKKLQDTKGNVTLGELSSYVIDNVKRKSVVANKKLQTPTATASQTMMQKWHNMKLK